jgi:alanyl-tRNA synthetase
MTSSAQLRKAFLDYFAEQGHQVVPSSPLVPANDPTLLFTNAGMVQFKEVFLGLEQRPYTRAASAQRCVRAGGKHNDLENVGYTARHHTFFEMLGNFSFGDYFKHEAIGYAWGFLTEVLKLPPERLWITVYEDDNEAADIWLREIGVSPERFTRCGAEDNFWSMGDTGPCGPCSEIFYDHGPQVEGGPPGTPEADGDRYVEVWNLVFMQYDRDKDGNLAPLPKPSVDTGMGLERLAAVMQEVHGNYDIDLFRGLIEAAARLAGCEDTGQTSLRVLADHIRSSAFLVADGVTPSNEGRGYVLRRIIRRAIRHGYRLGIDEVFFYRLVAPLVSQMGDAYPELVRAQERVEQALRLEEERFRATLAQGMTILEQDLSELQGDSIPGEVAFKLYDTYGFPVDLTADIARERGLRVDMEGFERQMQGQRARARAASHFQAADQLHAEVIRPTEFQGYEHLRVEGEEVIGLYVDNRPVERVEAGQQAIVVLDRTPFYAESGGQVGDRGTLTAADGAFRVEDTVKVAGAMFGHVGRVKLGSLTLGDRVSARVDEALRRATALNHSATHLMHAALRQVLGEHVAQKGSLVDAERLRFDFSHFEPVRPDQLRAIERIVNAQVRANLPVETRIMDIRQAMESGAMALFGEKYGDRVRVLSMGDFSVELCGGTHVQRSGDIGLFLILAESGVAAGVRRIEAVTGERAVELLERRRDTLEEAAALVKAGGDDLVARVRQLVDRNRRLEKELQALKAKLAGGAGADLSEQAVDVGDIKVIAARIDAADAKSLRAAVDRLKDKLPRTVVVLAGVNDGKIALIAGVSKTLAPLSAGDLVREVAGRIGGKGGGRQDMAQGGGKDLAALDQALAATADWVRGRVGEQ